MRRILFCLALLAIASGQGCPSEQFYGLVQEYAYGGYGGGYYSDYDYYASPAYYSTPVYYDAYPSYDSYWYYEDYGYYDDCGYYSGGCW